MGAFNSTTTTSSNYIISYVKGEGRVIIIIVYPLKIYPPRITTSRRGFCSFPIDEQYERKRIVGDVAIVTQKRSAGDVNYWSGRIKVIS